jgi:hypothetical protein
MSGKQVAGARPLTYGMSIVILAWMAMDDLVAGAEIALAAPPAVRDIGSRKRFTTRQVFWFLEGGLEDLSRQWPRDLELSDGK